jgi:MoaA/NifB/PqqE/SkfB family radical SAM enzyme
MQEFKAFRVTWGRVARVLRTHAARGVTRLHLTGGEPTIHPRFNDILRLARKLGMRTSVGTIGTRLVDEDFAREALPLLDEALFSLHGPNAAIHDEMAGRKGSFEQVTRAISMSQELQPGFGTYVNTVVTRKNLERLPDTVALAESLGAKLIVVSNLTPEGLGLDAYESLAVPLEDLARVLPQLPARLKKASLRYFGVPMCLLGQHRMLSNDLHWDSRVTVEWASQPGKVVFKEFYNWDPGRKREHTKECTTCKLKPMCMGVFDRYKTLWPTKALTPETSPNKTQAGDG